MNWAKFFTVALLATIKTLVSPPVGYAAHLSFTQTFAAVLSGGLFGFVFFYFSFHFLVKYSDKKFADRNRQKKIHRARKIIKLKQRLSTWLFLLVLPLFSIPVMAFIIRKFYCRSKIAFSWSLGVITIWSIGMCLLYSPMLNL